MISLQKPLLEEIEATAEVEEEGFDDELGPPVAVKRLSEDSLRSRLMEIWVTLFTIVLATDAAGEAVFTIEDGADIDAALLEVCGLELEGNFKIFLVTSGKNSCM